MSCDPLWHRAWKRLLELHVEKSSTYGTGEDRFANFTAVADANGQPPELYVLERMLEKTTRAINMVRAGRANDVREYPDLASLGLCAEALRARRLPLSGDATLFVHGQGCSLLASEDGKRDPDE